MISKIKKQIFLLILVFIQLGNIILQAQDITSYNPIWKSQSKNSLESMPCGGGDVGMNVWVENGDLLIYLSRSGTFDELNSFPKLGRIRVSLSPNLFNNPDNFHQELKLKEGFVQIIASKDGVEATVNVWADVFNPVAHIDVESNKPINILTSYEGWRYAERQLSNQEKDVCRTYHGAPVKAVVKKDTVKFSGQGVLFYHRNSGETAFDVAVKQQGLEHVKSEMWNPIKNLAFGGRFSGKNMVPYDKTDGRYASTDYRGWRLKSVKPSRRHNIRVVMHTAYVQSDEEWINGLLDIEEKVAGEYKKARINTLKWWSDFWDRSYIIVDKENPDADNVKWQVGRNYQVFRYQLGCNAYGSYPSKFNGGLFTTDPEYVHSNQTYTPDYRVWGGGSFVAQNQRLLYWPMLKSGDLDMMPSQFDFYVRPLKNAELRTKVYWGHNGASFTEQMESFALPIGFEYGWERPAYFDPGVEYNSWVEYQWDNSLEFCWMILEYHRYSGNDISQYMPLIESCLVFYDEHYQMRTLHRTRTKNPQDENGHLVIYPGTACETYKMATNPTPTITALRTVINGLLELPDSYLDDERREYYKGYLNRIPPISFREKNGRKTIAPAARYERIQNVELPQLYPVFPYGVYGIGRPDIQVAIDTWKHGADNSNQKQHISWHQDAIFCARLGLTSEAADITIKKMKDSGRRFPTFWGPGHDWVPDHNWGGSGMIGLQEMLMQTVDKKIYLLPAWPKDWDVDFKLHAPYKTTVEGRVKDGEVIELKVTPESRRKDIVIM